MNRRDHLLSGPATLTVLGAALIVCTLVSFLFGRYPVPFRELCGILGDRFLSLFGGGIDQFWTDAMYAAVWNVRLPRVLMSVLVGACLSAAGAAYQGVFQNPMAAPDVLGASAGAGFGAALAIFFGLSSAQITVSAFGMSLLTVALVFWVSRRAKGEKTLGLVLAGIMISSLFEAGTSFIKLAADPNNKLPEITYWLMGSLSGANGARYSSCSGPCCSGWCLYSPCDGGSTCSPWATTRRAPWAWTREGCASESSSPPRSSRPPRSASPA